MSVAEMKEQIAALTVEERLDIAALISHLNRRDDPEFQQELARRMAEMDAGKKVSEEEIKRLVEKLNQ